MATVPAKEVVTEYSKITRKNFPEGFVFGTATSAYQVEGAATGGGRGISVWDDFTMRTPYRISDGSNGNLAVDMYNRFKEDIRMMKSMGFDAYRFSISWPRLIPSGKICHGVNREGVDYYNDVINTLLAHGIQPHVTLFHWDLPDALEKEYGGFLSENIVDDYRDYVDLCFWEFGDRVKHWATFNEPWSYCYIGYVRRTFPPGKKVVITSAETAGAGAQSTSTKRTLITRDLPSNYGAIHDDTPLALHDDRMDVYVPPPTVHVPITSAIRTFGISARAFYAEPSFGTSAKISSRAAPDISEHDKEPFIAAKNMILAHAAAMKLYKRKYKDHQEGQIGIALNTHWFEGLTDTKEDQDAARRVHDFKLGWFLEPVLTGRYPKTMRKYVPLEAQFTSGEYRSLRKYRIDFLGLNYYTARYVQNNPNPDHRFAAFDRYQYANVLDKKGDKEIGPAPGAPWLRIVPWGIKKLLNKINELYNNSRYKLSTIYITENGVAQRNDPKVTACEVIADKTRVEYYRDHLGNILDVINEWKILDLPTKLEIKGYFAWSWIDNFEWAAGYTMRFGLIYTDYMNDLKRYPKLSAVWFSQFLAGKIPKLLNGKVLMSLDGILAGQPKSLDGKSAFRSLDPMSLKVVDDDDDDDDDSDDDKDDSEEDDDDHNDDPTKKNDDDEDDDDDKDNDDDEDSDI